jgi:hypothetical protein
MFMKGLKLAKIIIFTVLAREFKLREQLVFIKLVHCRLKG